MLMNMISKEDIAYHIIIGKMSHYTCPYFWKTIISILRKEREMDAFATYKPLLYIKRTINKK